ncbi:MAG TPA: GAF domain-containing protein [Chloroflexia bacterium]|nr:GAF domain-containing protein [Chloroflexia bacterium]
MSTIDAENALDNHATARLDGDLQDATEDSLSSRTLTPLLEWARHQGEAAAQSGLPVQTAIEQVMQAASALEGPLAGLEGAVNLAATLAGAAADGYISARESASQGASNSAHLRSRLAELTALHRINSAANSSLKLADMLRETAQAVVAVTQTDVCTIFLYDPEWDQLVLAATSGPNQEAVGKIHLRLGEGITGWAAMVGKPLAVTDAWDDTRFKYIPALQEDRTVSMLAVPVVLFTKEKLVGVITAHTFDAREFTDNETKFLETVAGEMAITIENARLYEQTDSQLRQKVAELSTLQGVSAHIAATLNLSEVLTLIAYQAAHLVHADAAAIYELHPDAGILELVTQYDLQDPNHSIHQGKSGSHAVVTVDESDIAQAIVRGIPVPLPAGADEELGLPFAQDGYRSMFCVPLVAPRAIMGGICLYNREEKTFSEDQVRLLDAFAHEAAIALENSRLYDAALRGLKTKSAMLQEMNHRVRNNLQTVAGLLSMQLRRMKPEGEAAKAVRESIARIQSMAAVHDLMTSGDVESTSVYELARKVAEAEVATFNKPDFDLSINIEPDEAERIRIGSHEATLLALLLNELISNAILHGFEGLDKGKITVRAWLDPGNSSKESRSSLSHNQPPMIRIEVADDGVGLPPDFDPNKHGNLGLNIVRTLVESDLRGEFTIEPGKHGGTIANVAFRPARG